MNQPFTSLLEIDLIPEPFYIFEKLNIAKYCYSYFQVNSTYYLFFYAAQKSNSLLEEELYKSLTVIQELNTKTRWIRSLRGFLLYTLEIRKDAQRLETLQTNLPSFFWTRVDRILRQSDRRALEDFLFGASKSVPEESQSLEEQFQRIENNITFLTQEIKELKESLVLKNPPETFNPLETRTLSTRRSSQSEISFKKLNEIPKINKLEEKMNFQVNQKYGYIRVSSKSQESNSSLEAQKQELLRHEIPLDNIRIEVGSAADSINSRPILKHLIDVELQTNDLLMVTKIDRCSRNTLSFLELQEQLFQRSITFVALDIPCSTDLSSNRFVATCFSAIAAFENDRRRDRQAQGISAAKQAGKYKGRKTVIDKALISKVKYFKQESALTVTQIAKLTRKSRATIYKVLKDHLGYVPNQPKLNESKENEKENDKI